jgi:hypothetical protein
VETKLVFLSLEIIFLQRNNKFTGKRRKGAKKESIKNRQFFADFFFSKCFYIIRDKVLLIS